METWYEEQIEEMITALWDKGWELYPEICWPVPNMEVRDINNQEKQTAYRRGCVDAIEMFFQVLRKNKLCSLPEIVMAEKNLRKLRQNNGL